MIIYLMSSGLLPLRWSFYIGSCGSYSVVCLILFHLFEHSQFLSYICKFVPLGYLDVVWDSAIYIYGFLFTFCCYCVIYPNLNESLFVLLDDLHRQVSWASHVCPACQVSLQVELSNFTPCIFAISRMSHSSL
jgi:hypothetical protein